MIRPSNLATLRRCWTSKCIARGSRAPSNSGTNRAKSQGSLIASSDLNDGSSVVSIDPAKRSSMLQSKARNSRPYPADRSSIAEGGRGGGVVAGDRRPKSVHADRRSRSSVMLGNHGESGGFASVPEHRAESIAHGRKDHRQEDEGVRKSISSKDLHGNG